MTLVTLELTLPVVAAGVQRADERVRDKVQSNCKYYPCEEGVPATETSLYREMETPYEQEQLSGKYFPVVALNHHARRFYFSPAPPACDSPAV